MNHDQRHKYLVSFVVLAVFVLTSILAGAQVFRWKHGHRRSDQTGPVAQDQPLSMFPDYSTTPLKIFMDNNYGNIFASGSFLTSTGTVTAATGTFGNITTSGSLTASTGTITAGTGTFNGFSSLSTSGSITVAGNVTAATGTVSSATGSFSTMTATILYGDGSALTGISHATPTLAQVTAVGDVSTRLEAGTGAFGTITASGSISASTGTVTGDIGAFNNLGSMVGSSLTVSGSITASTGTVTASTGTFGNMLTASGTASMTSLRIGNSGYYAELGRTNSNNDFTLTNQVLLSGVMGNGAEFNNTGSQFASGTSASIESGGGGGNWTVSLWMIMEVADSHPSFTFSTNTIDANSTMQGFMYFGTNLYVYYKNAAGAPSEIYCSVGTLDLNKPYHLAITHSTADVTNVYLNHDAAIHLLSCSAPTGGYRDSDYSGIRLNKHNAAGFVVVGGKNAYNEVRLYNTVLSYSDIQTLYAGGNGTASAVGIGIVAWYGCHDGATATIVDSGSAGTYNMAVSGGPVTNYTWSGFPGTRNVVDSSDSYDYFGDQYGNEVFRGATTTLTISGTTQAQFTSAGGMNVLASATFATNSVKVGNIQAAAFATSTTLIAQAGSVDITQTNASAAIIFPFAYPNALVSVICTGGLDGIILAKCSVSDESKTGFTINTDAIAGTSTKFYWQAWGK